MADQFEEENPYAAPKSEPASVLQLELSKQFIYTDGLFMYVKDGAILPGFCPVTNQPLSPEDKIKKRLLSWAPPWSIILMLIGLYIYLLPGLIVALVFQKKAKVTFGLSKEFRSRSLKFSLSGLGMFIISLASILYVLLNIDTKGFGLLIAASGILLIISFVILSKATPIKANGFKNGYLRIKGCSPEFLTRLEHLVI